MTLQPCPHCFIKYADTTAPAGRESGRRLLHPETAINCLSRRNCNDYICGDCGKAEALADMCMPGMHRDQDAVDAMFRLVVYNDRCEGKRLPPGIALGPSGTLSSGSALGHKDEYEDRCECGSMHLWGFVCTDCQTERPAYEQLKDHPEIVARHLQGIEQAKRDHIAQVAREKAARKEAESRKLRENVDRYLGASWQRDLYECLNCGALALQREDDYICIKCRASDELAGTPLLAHVLMKLDQINGR